MICGDDVGYGEKRASGGAERCGGLNYHPIRTEATECTHMPKNGGKSGFMQAIGE